MARRSLRDPRVQFAIRRRAECQMRRRAREAVLRALEERQPCSPRELEFPTGLSWGDVCLALDQLRVRNLVVLDEAAYQCWLVGFDPEAPAAVSEGDRACG